MNAPLADPPPAWWTPAVRDAAASLRRRLQPGFPVRLTDLPAAGAALLAWMARPAGKAPLLWIAEGPAALDQAWRDLRALAPDAATPVVRFPALDPDETGTPPRPENGGERLHTLLALADGAHPVIVASIQALMQPVTAPDRLAAQTRLLRVGDTLDFTALPGLLESAGYSCEPEVREPGQAVIRGGLLDIWPPAEPEPLRIELFGSTVDSIRCFDPETQASRAPRPEARLTPVSDRAHTAAAREQDTLAAFLPPDTVVVWHAEATVAAMAAGVVRAARDQDRPPPIPLEALETAIQNRGLREIRTGCPDTDDTFGFEPLPPVVTVTRDGFRPDLAAQQRQAFLDRLAEQARRGACVTLFFESEGAKQRFQETAPPPIRDRAAPRLASLSEGFIHPSLGLAIASESDLYGRRKTVPGRLRSETARRRTGLRLGSLSEIQPGDRVVHLDHGIGLYRGLGQVVVAGQPQEVLIVEYADEARLYVPIHHAHLLTRYVGMGKRTARLHALGGTRWTADRQAAEKAVQDLAAGLLETQAARDLQPGHAFSPDTPWQHEFEAAFPYRETDDQAQAVADVKRDMEQPRPMDRLICGDAGYGKTEVAMRAAFKAVMDGKQVAVLVPTTVLAQQHFFTFTERMGPFPVRIAMFSRLCRAAQRSLTRQELASGAVDIVIGTHGLLDPQVQFKDLGLVVVDEEQRFGVAQKERLKQMRQLVDVMTLTATPIPRTLYMSLTGIRDLSLIQTPPSDRLPVETRVAENSDAVVRNAIRRELSRGGQIYFLHNRVHTIDLIRQRIQRLAPEARLAVAHGQMPPRQLADLMRAFVRGDCDVLICTTLIESGTDIPNANTILIDRADRFGLADLYQLRGRAGRSREQGYCLMLLPPHGLVDPAARRRILALRQHAGFGAGFRIAMRDLEIRGSGNILGHAQSGHIAAIGFTLYCQLLRRTVDRLQGHTPEAPVADVPLDLDFVRFSPEEADRDKAALIPASYIDDEALKITHYRLIAAAVSEDETHALRRRCRDRFGPLPESVERLFLLADIRILAARKGLRAVATRQAKILLTLADGSLLHDQRRLPRFRTDSVTGRLKELKARIRLIPDSDPADHASGRN